MNPVNLDYARLEVQVFAAMPKRHAELSQQLRPLTQTEILERKEIGMILFYHMYTHNDRCYKIDPPVPFLGEALCNCHFGQFTLGN